ncbi:GGDEF domain-containing protein [Planomonospora sp. ID67723]|uniref:GGDEF domain-containing protein n=1 Tax=Planomonospora sp. ID67723 TaxID=2738134 RepID=UPI0018C36C0D|nr:GGDEF domain-containing protein [Planomonospora sp. ID67723]MBG0830559.1 GGDEF domain-containing protein [Planomonospora sp. ID67723]
MTVGGTRLFLGTAVTAAFVTAVFYAVTVGQVLYFVTYGVVCALAWWAALRLVPGPDRRPWLLIALAQTLWLTGDVIEMAFFLSGKVPMVGVSDAFWLGGYPLVAAAVILMARRRAPGRLSGGMLDALTLTTVAALAAWQFLIQPYLDSGSGAEVIVPALYPVGDIVLLAAVLFLALSPGERGAPTLLLLGAVSTYLAVDLGYNLLPYVLDSSYVEKLGAGLLAGHALMVSAMLHPGRAELTHPGSLVRTLHPARVVFLGLALLGTPALALRYAGFSGQELATITASAACAVFVLTRFTTAVREQERMQAALAYQARHDPLTGLANRAVMQDRLEEIVRVAGSGAAVLYLDLDGFKQINDVHGHDAGDAVLVEVAGRLSAATRGTDLVARLGGDEFVLLCPEIPPEETVRLAERVLEEICAPVLFRGHRLSVGASIGIAVHSGGLAAGTPAEILRAADTAMYSAKRLGRGRWVAAGESGPLMAA